MERPFLGRSGIAIVVIVTILLFIEDLLILINTGTMPAIKFLLLDLMVLGILVAAIYEARRHYIP